jgi:hypothetical protein
MKQLFISVGLALAFFSTAHAAEPNNDPSSREIPTESPPCDLTLRPGLSRELLSESDRQQIEANVQAAMTAALQGLASGRSVIYQNLETVDELLAQIPDLPVMDLAADEAESEQLTNEMVRLASNYGSEGGALKAVANRAANLGAAGRFVARVADKYSKDQTAARPTGELFREVIQNGTLKRDQLVDEVAELDNQREADLNKIEELQRQLARLEALEAVIGQQIERMNLSDLDRRLFDSELHAPVVERIDELASMVEYMYLLLDQSQDQVRAKRAVSSRLTRTLREFATVASRLMQSDAYNGSTNAALTRDAALRSAMTRLMQAAGDNHAAAVASVAKLGSQGTISDEVAGKFRANLERGRRDLNAFEEARLRTAQQALEKRAPLLLQAQARVQKQLQVQRARAALLPPLESPRAIDAPSAAEEPK